MQISYTTTTMLGMQSGPVEILRHGSARDKNLRVVGLPILLKYIEPMPVDGKALTSGYKFTAQYATWTFLNPTGAHDHPPCRNEYRLNNALPCFEGGL